jgi:hypothetical protein
MLHRAHKRLIKKAQVQEKSSGVVLGSFPLVIAVPLIALGVPRITKAMIWG